MFNSSDFCGNSIFFWLALPESLQEKIDFSLKAGPSVLLPEGSSHNY